MLSAGGSGVSLNEGPDLKLFILVGWDRKFLSAAWPTGVITLSLILTFMQTLLSHEIVNIPNLFILQPVI